MTNATTAARMGRLTGTTYRETAKVVRMIDWREVGSIVLHGLVALVVLTYVLGEVTGRGVHRLNDRLARLWVRLWVVEDHPLTTTPVVDRQPVNREPQRVPDPDPAVVTIEMARDLMAAGLSQRAVSKELGVPRTTLRRMLARA